MSDFLSNLSLIGDAIFSLMTSIFSLYTGQVILAAALGLWVLRRIMKIFHLL